MIVSDDKVNMIEFGTLLMNVCIDNKEGASFFYWLDKYLVGYLHKHMIKAAIVKYIILPCMKQGN